MNAFRSPAATGLLTIVAGFALSLANSASWATGQDGARHVPADANKTQSPTGTVNGPGIQPSTSPHCDITGAKAIRITCHYSASPLTDVGNREPRVVLNDAILMFKTRDDNYMHVDLTFTNDGKNAILDAHPVYLEIDDDAGNNYVRRPLPHVDFRNLPPGGQRTFSERLLAPAFQPRPYIIWLWIPDPDPSSKFDSAHNFLLSSAGVPDSKSGLNLIAKFSVAR
jgi:hypothetical protein